MSPSGLLLVLATAWPAALAQDGGTVPAASPDVAPVAPELRTGPLGARFVWEQRGGIGRRVASLGVQPLPAGVWILADEQGGVWLSEDEGRTWDNVVRAVAGLDDPSAIDDEDVLLEAEARREETFEETEFERLTVDPVSPLSEEEIELPEAPDPDEADLEDAAILAVDLAAERAEAGAAPPLVWFDTNDAERAYVARADGLWLTTSSGRTWEHVFVALPEDPGVTAFAHAPDGALLLGTTDGVRYATDDGATWIDYEDASDGSVVADVVVEGGRIWAATNRGLYGSQDGLRWEQVRLPASAPVRAIVPDPTWDDGFWVASSAALYRTDDGGATFYAAGRQPLRGLRRLVHLDNPGHLLATSDDGMWESVDGGVAWTIADRLLSDPDVRALSLSESGPVIATATGVWRMVEPRETLRDLRPVKSLPLSETIGAATHRDGFDIDLLSLAKYGVGARFVPTLELRFDWGSAARRVVDYTSARTGDDFDNDWRAGARLCWGGCSSSVYVSQAGTGDYAVEYDYDRSLTVVGGRVFDEGEPVAAAANVAQSIRSYRRYLAEHVADAWLARSRLATQSVATLSLREQVLHRIQIDELDARLDALTGGAFTRGTLSSFSGESR